MSNVHKFEFERRSHLRVLYPKKGTAGFLPGVQILGLDCQPVNISEGGACLNIGNDKQLTAYREEAQLILKFPYEDKNHEILAQVVGSVHWNRHIRFLQIEEETRVLLNIAVQPGVLGIGTRIKSPGALGLRQPGYEEWSCPFGGNLRLNSFFAAKGEVLMEYRVPDYAVEFHFGEVPMRKKSRGSLEAQPVETDTFDRIYLTLLNIREPSARVSAMVKYLEEFRPQVTRGGIG